MALRNRELHARNDDAIQREIMMSRTETDNI